MGIGPKNLVRLQDLCQKRMLPPGAQVLELGAQEVYCKGHEQFVRDFNRYFVESSALGWKAEKLTDERVAQLASQGFASELFRACGFQYRAFDIFDGDSVTLFDLNIQMAPPEMAGTIDLVTNFGTTEHLINQLLAMRTIHELTKVGGCMHHDLPMGGYHLHGYFSYNPMFFQHLAKANGYELVYEGFSCSDTMQPAPPTMIKQGWSTPGGWVNSGIEVVLRKMSDQPFRMPLETGTSLGLNPAVWGGDDPYGRVPQPDPAAAAGNALLPLDQVSGWDLQQELLRRYLRRIRRIVGAS